MALGNVNDLFQTQADINQMSFSDPFNPVNMNSGQGQWGVDPSLLTPSYTGIYRPQWQGSGQGMYAGAYGGFGPALNQAINPFVAAPYGGFMGGVSPYNQMAGTYSALGSRPIGGALSFAQNMAVPFAAQLLLQNTGWNMGSAIGRATLGDFAEGALGTGFGGLARGAAGLAGGFAGSALLPMAAVYMADQGFRHYGTQRIATQSFLSDLGDQNFGPGVGNLVTGQGVSRLQAAKLAKGLDYAGSNDWMLDGRDYEKIADLSMKTGLLDNAQFKNFLPKIKQISASVKFLIQAANLPDVQQAIELLAQLKTQGADISNATRVVNSYARASAIGGVSTDYLMNTVGNQASYMFSAAGLTPYVGSNIAANQYASYRNAYRQGLLSPALVAQMGGLQGMTQSYTGGVLQMAQTPIADIQGYLLSRGVKGVGNSLLGDIGSIGQMAAQNPVDVLGGMAIGRSAYQSEFTKHPEALTADMMKNLAQMNPAFFSPRNGQWTPEQFMAGSQAMGMSPDAAKALLLQQLTKYDPKAVAARLHGDEIASVKTRMAALQAANQDYGMLNPLMATYEGAKSWLSGGAANAMGYPSEAGAGLGDWIESIWSGARYGSKGFTIGERSGPEKQLSVSAATDILTKRLWTKRIELGVHGGTGVDADKWKPAMEAMNSTRQNMSKKDGELYDSLISQKTPLSTAQRTQFSNLVSKYAGHSGSDENAALVDLVVANPGELLTKEKKNQQAEDILGRYKVSNAPSDWDLLKMAVGLPGPDGSYSLAPKKERYQLVSQVMAQQLLGKGRSYLDHLELNSKTEEYAKAMGVTRHKGENDQDYLKRIVNSALDLGGKSIGSGTTGFNEELAALAKGAAYTGKDQASYLAELSSQAGISTDELKKRVDALRKSLPKGTESQYLSEIEKNLKKGDTSLVKGFSVEGALKSFRATGLDKDGEITYIQGMQQNAAAAQKDREIQTKLMQGVRQGVISSDTYSKTMLMMQEKKDYKTFSTAVDVFAAAVKVQSDTNSKDRAADRKRLDQVLGSFAANSPV